MFIGLLNKNCSIKRRAITNIDAFGNIVSGWSDVASDIPCRVERINAPDDGQDSRSGVFSNSPVMFYMQPTDVKVDDNVFVDDKEYRVIDVEDFNLLNHHLEIQAEIVEEA